MWLLPSLSIAPEIQSNAKKSSVSHNWSKSKGAYDSSGILVFRSFYSTVGDVVHASTQSLTCVQESTHQWLRPWEREGFWHRFPLTPDPQESTLLPDSLDALERLHLQRQRNTWKLFNLLLFLSLVLPQDSKELSQITVFAPLFWYAGLGKQAGNTIIGDRGRLNQLWTRWILRQANGKKQKACYEMKICQW